jgi:hypothetical protein
VAPSGLSEDPMLALILGSSDTPADKGALRPGGLGVVLELVVMLALRLFHCDCHVGVAALVSARAQHEWQVVAPSAN